MRKYYGKEIGILSPTLQSDTDSQDTHKCFPLLLNALLAASSSAFNSWGSGVKVWGSFWFLNKSILAGKYSNLEKRNVLNILSCAVFQCVVNPKSITEIKLQYLDNATYFAKSIIFHCFLKILIAFWNSNDFFLRWDWQEGENSICCTIPLNEV